MSKPGSLPAWIPGNEVEFLDDPGSTKTQGWQTDMMAPPLQFNWFWNLVSQWLEFVDACTQTDGLNVVEDGSILFNGSSYNVGLALNTAGTEFGLLPDTTSVTDLAIGNNTYKWKNIDVEISGDITFNADDNVLINGSTSTTITSPAIGLTGSTEVTFTTPNANFVTDTITLTQPGISTINLVGSTTQQKTLNIGTSGTLFASVLINCSASVGFDCFTFGVAAGTNVVLEGTTGYVVVDAGLQFDVDAGSYINMDAVTYFNMSSGTTFGITAGSTIDITAGGHTTIRSDQTAGSESDYLYLGNSTYKWLQMHFYSSGLIYFHSSIVVPTDTPASSGAVGAAGQIAWDSSYIYVCIGSNSWKRVAIATW